MPLEFSRSQALSVGVELELMVLNTRDFDLSRGATDLLARLDKVKIEGAVKPEITESMIEVNSSVQTRYANLLDELTRTRDAIVTEAGRLNLVVAGGGAHPFHHWSDRRIVPTERFLRVSQLYGYLAKQFTVFGQHVHVGVESGDDAIYTTHRMSRYIPHFIALSAASPFYQGEDTSFETSRLHAVSAFPLAGHLPAVTTWAEFNGYFDEMASHGIVESMKDFYWDIRPKPEYGTIEVRICDTPLTVETAAQLAAYAQTLTADFLRHRQEPPLRAQYMVYGYNRFQACRFGFEAQLADPQAHGHVRLRDDLLATLDRIAPLADELGTTAALSAIAERARAGANDALWLRQQFEKTRSLPDMVRLQAARWRDVPGAKAATRAA
ncbi:YbdK family carboxylate-amine ligase [Usitatibacter palustris]|uniref:Putative glutamate--cysteine ligase 2 n=1 Tax=Usitatibacter palustris TaxID=2732487 RepID=A0A6M4H5L8_9PROT|nr:YbdK family carboxylate-amine ligase [Usitatibacter palustris]QJR13824.1 Putative glutamate--cysteine ligase 2 [Usitatibacter palustris]